MKLCYVGDEGRVGLFSEECQQIICEVSIVEESGSTVLLVLYFILVFFSVSAATRLKRLNIS